MTTNADTIGMMTFHASHNNGSMLQALALQHILENHFHQKTELIDFPTRASVICTHRFQSLKTGNKQLKA